MRKVLSLSVYFIVYLCFSSGFSQSFEFQGDSPFGIKYFNVVDSARGALMYKFKDYDADGDLDLFLIGQDPSDTISESEIENLRYFIETQENIGTKWNPIFKEREHFFENFNYPVGGGFFAPAIDDLNADGKQDFVISAEVDSSLNQFLRFDMQISDFNFETFLCTDFELSSFVPGSFFIPELIDLDMDGDLDLLMSGAFPPFFGIEQSTYALLYAKNIGTDTDPDFLGWFSNPYGLEIDTFPEFLSGGDIDLDGDVDFLGIVQNDTMIQIKYYENNSSSDGRPSFSGFTLSPYGLPTARDEEDGFLFPSLTDIDGDGDLDLFLPHIDTIFTLDFYENKLCDLEELFFDITICEGESYFIGDQEFTTVGTYHVETILASNCKKLTHLTLEVLPTTTIQINEELCAGESFYLGDVEITESGTYELSLMSTSGCDSTVIANIEFIQLETSITQEGSILTAHFSNDYFYQWFDCYTDEDIFGATENVFVPIYSGDFAIRISNVIGCEEESICYSVIVSGLTTIDEKENIYLVPNPTHGLISIINQSNKVIERITLFSRSGKLIEGVPVSIRPNSVDLSFLPQGIYMLVIDIADKKLVKRVILLK